MKYTTHKLTRSEKERIRTEELFILSQQLDIAWKDYNQNPTPANYAAVETLTRRYRQLTKGK